MVLELVSVRPYRYILPFNGGLPETGAYAPMSRYPASNLRGVNGMTVEAGGDELAERLAMLKAMQEDPNYIPN